MVDPESGRLPRLNKRSCIDREGIRSWPSALEFTQNEHIAYILSTISSKGSVICADFYIWNLDEAEGKPYGHVDKCDTMTLSTNGEIAILNSGIITTKDVHTGEIRKISSKLVKSEKMIYLTHYLLYSPSNQQIYAGEPDSGRVTIWDLNEEGPAEGSPSRSSMIRDLSLSTDLNSLASYENGQVKVWDAATQRLRCTIKEIFHDWDDDHPTPCFSLWPDGSRIAIVTDLNHIFVCDARSGAKIGQSTYSDNQARHWSWYPTGIAFSPDVTRIAIAYRSRYSTYRLLLWKVTAEGSTVTFDSEIPLKFKDELHVNVDLPMQYINNLMFHPSGQYLLCWTWKGIWVWDVTGSSPTLVDPEIISLLLAETADIAALEYGKYQTSWLIVGSPPHYSFALPADFQAIAHSIKSNKMALGSQDGRIIIIDYAHLMERYPLDIEYWKSIVQIWQLTDEEISITDENNSTTDEVNYEPWDEPNMAIYGQNARSREKGRQNRIRRMTRSRLLRRRIRRCGRRFIARPKQDQ